jgi:hypothetical protein
VRLLLWILLLLHPWLLFSLLLALLLHSLLLCLLCTLLLLLLLLLPCEVEVTLRSTSHH